MIHVKAVTYAPPQHRDAPKHHSMNSLNNRTRIRQLAGYLLLVWVFALGASVVHACAVASPLTASDHADKITAAVATHHQVESGSHEHAPTGSIGKATCVKFCADAKAAPSLPESSGDLPAAALLQPWPMGRLYDEPLAAALITALAREPSNRRTLPIAIEFLRLAL